MTGPRPYAPRTGHSFAANRGWHGPGGPLLIFPGGIGLCVIYYGSSYLVACIMKL